MEIIEINGKLYKKKKPFEASKKLPYSAPHYYFKGELIQIYNTDRKLFNVNLLQEYRNILTKTSKLSFSRREAVKELFFSLFEEIDGSVYIKLDDLIADIIYNDSLYKNKFEIVSDIKGQVSLYLNKEAYGEYIKNHIC